MLILGSVRLPSLSRVGGDLKMISSELINCKQYRSQYGPESNFSLGGQFSCPAPYLSLSKGAAAGVGVGVALGFVLCVAVYVIIKRRRKRREKARSGIVSYDKDGRSVQPPAVRYGRGEEHELERPRAEQPVGSETQELRPPYAPPYGQAEQSHYSVFRGS